MIDFIIISWKKELRIISARSLEKKKKGEQKKFPPRYTSNYHVSIHALPERTMHFQFASLQQQQHMYIAPQRLRSLNEHANIFSSRAHSNLQPSLCVCACEIERDEFYWKIGIINVPPAHLPNPSRIISELSAVQLTRRFFTFFFFTPPTNY